MLQATASHTSRCALVSKQSFKSPVGFTGSGIFAKLPTCRTLAIDGFLVEESLFAEPLTLSNTSIDAGGLPRPVRLRDVAKY